MLTDVKQVKIKKSILHVINGSDSHFSNILLPTDNPKFTSFLMKHIRSTARTNGRQASKFNNPENNDILKNFNLMFTSDQEFINSSKILANNLSSICLDGGYGPFDLIFCEYENNEQESVIAVLLLEFSTGFFHEFNENTDTLIKDLTILASSSSKLKKCALVKSYNENDSYNLIINDKNKTEFFCSTFLNCQYFMDDRKATETFIEKTIIWVNDKNKDTSLSPTIKNKLEEVKSQCISCISEYDTIDLDVFEDNFFRDDIEYLKEDYNKYLESSGLITRQISLNDDITNEYKVHKITLNNNAKLILPVDLAYDNTNDYYKQNINSDGIAEFNIKGIIVDETVKSK